MSREGADDEAGGNSSPGRGDELDPAVVPIADPLAGMSIVLGVTGSIAAVKAIDLTSRLVRAKAVVDVVMTRSAAEFIRPIAFQAITHRPISADLWKPADPSGMDHIQLSREADLMLVAPATADTIARLALGRADDALTTTALALNAPLVVAPAMEPEMWSHPATQANVATLHSRGVYFVGPVEGRLASGKMGLGRMEEPQAIVDALRWRLSRGGVLDGRTVLISAGPTRESIDPLRFISNRSTGRMGIALAEAARDAGADVVLVLGPVDRPSLRGVEVVDVESAKSLAEAVLEASSSADVIIMAAAVADFTPAVTHPGKLKKMGRDRLTLELERTQDVLGAIAEEMGTRAADTLRPFIVGFAAETHDLEAEARRKFEAKNLDLVIANQIPAGFGDRETNVLMLGADGSSRSLSGPKRVVAGWIVGVIAAALAAKQ